MPDYRRVWHPVGTYFFTVNLLQREGNDLLTRHIGGLRNIVQSVQRRYAFAIPGWVMLAEHLHCVIELPLGDADYATRWRLIYGILKIAPGNGAEMVLQDFPTVKMSRTAETDGARL